MRRKKKQWWGKGDILHDFEAFRLHLGPAAYEYTDPQLKQLWEEMKILADILVESYMIRRGKEDDASELEDGRA